ncbi:hypothetical protein [Bacillus methanolicus]|uniref:Secreted protein n=2 Tax=Bacillus methanolicus TaxID=1471 RepID=I3EBC2_BACMM|nr:hypothetical protein [Bacillus methanolicus]AIE61473.1 hypothetical protein BMMGA3_15600 [Bacillus methanolicus MGA3]EIJ83793.1 hypothetical protein MGA3_00800 [Bacillus methanolicus MGA3]
MKKAARVIALILALFVVSAPINTTVNASTINQVKWGKMYLKKGMIGKLIILQNTNIYSKGKNGNLIVAARAKKGQEIGVYTFKNNLYGVGGNRYIKKTSAVKYQTPSKQMLSKLRVVTKGLKLNPKKTYVYYDYTDHVKDTWNYTGTDNNRWDLWTVSRENGEKEYYAYKEDQKNMAFGPQNSEIILKIPFPLTVNKKWEYFVYEGDPVEKFTVTSLSKDVKTHAGTFKNVIEIKSSFGYVFYFAEGTGLVLSVDKSGKRLYELYKVY